MCLIGDWDETNKNVNKITNALYIIINILSIQKLITYNVSTNYNLQLILIITMWKRENKVVFLINLVYYVINNLKT